MNDIMRGGRSEIVCEKCSGNTTIDTSGKWLAEARAGNRRMVENLLANGDLRFFVCDDCGHVVSTYTPHRAKQKVINLNAVAVNRAARRRAAHNRRA